MAEDVFDLLTVCTGNICRSPMAELIAARELAHGLGASAARFRVHSAGTHGLEGWAVNEPAAARLEALGIGHVDFRARLLVAEMVAHADLVLTATREHRSAVVRLGPRAASRTFTLREFARLVALVDRDALPSDDPVGRAKALVVAAAAGRGRVWVDPADDDIADPYGRSASVFEACSAEIAEALTEPLRVIWEPFHAMHSAPASTREASS
ncbi:MAG TPA: low molecular weight phosphatase family protein [Mycobacteriales bacterium]|nr:low molecular weight phosphatase family protein [Mycobacteriales bacterium]